MRQHRSQELKETLPEGVLSIAIRADFWQPQKMKEKRNWSHIDISGLSMTEWTYRYQNSCIQPCHGHFTAMPKRPKRCSFSSSSSHFLFPCDFSGTIADRNIIDTPLELLRPADVPCGGYKTETKDLGGIFWSQNRFLAVVAPPSEWKLE